jgi:conjugal transfer pilus assembly protein TraA
MQMNMSLNRNGATTGTPVARNVALLLVVMVGFAFSAFAGTTDTEFQQLFNKVISWVGGYAGKTVAVVFLAFGVIGGIARGTLVPALVGIGAALILAFGPGVLTGVVSATI